MLVERATKDHSFCGNRPDLILLQYCIYCICACAAPDLKLGDHGACIVAVLGSGEGTPSGLWRVVLLSQAFTGARCEARVTIPALGGEKRVHTGARQDSSHPPLSGSSHHTHALANDPREGVLKAHGATVVAVALCGAFRWVFVGCTLGHTALDIFRSTSPARLSPHLELWLVALAFLSSPPTLLPVIQHPYPLDPHDCYSGSSLQAKTAHCCRVRHYPLTQPAVL